MPTHAGFEPPAKVRGAHVKAANQTFSAPES
jgi:hypothetical protein